MNLSSRGDWVSCTCTAGHPVAVQDPEGFENKEDVRAANTRGENYNMLPLFGAAEP